MTWIALTVCAGGVGPAGAVGLAIAAVVAAIPAVVVVVLLQFLEGRTGKNGTYITASFGLIPLLLVVYNSGRGDPAYMIGIVLSGLIWSLAWIGISLLFPRRG